VGKKLRQAFNFRKIAQNDQPPNRQKFAQSGHPAGSMPSSIELLMHCFVSKSRKNRSPKIEQERRKNGLFFSLPNLRRVMFIIGWAV
jgi:hypothetical protein